MKLFDGSPAWFGFSLALINIVIAFHEQLTGTSYLLLCNGEHCYHKQMERMVNLSDAKSTCQGTLGGYVVHLETTDEQTWLMNSFMAVGESISMYWIGLERAGGNSPEWYWMSGASSSLATNLTNRWSPYPLSTDTTAVASGLFFMAYQNDSSAAFVCETEGSPYNGYCFENTSVTFYKSPGTNVYNYMSYMADFDTARTACEAYPDTHLLNLETTEEYIWINAMVPETSSMNIYWLGLRRETFAEDWYWLLPDNVTQPMNHSSFDNMYSEDLYAYNEYNMWKKSSRFMVRHFICETEIETAVESSLASSLITPSSSSHGVSDISTESFSSTPFVSYTTVAVSNSISPTNTYVLPTHTTVPASSWMDPTNVSLTTSAPGWTVPTNTTLIATGASLVNLSSTSNITYDSATQPLSVTPTINTHTMYYTTSGSTMQTYDSLGSMYDSFTPPTVAPSSVSFPELANNTYFATNTATLPMSSSSEGHVSDTTSSTMTPFVTTSIHGNSHYQPPYTTPSSTIASANISLQLNSFVASGLTTHILNATSLTQSGPSTHLSSTLFSTSNAVSPALSTTSTTMTMSSIILSTTSPSTITSSISHSHILSTTPSISPSMTASSVSYSHAVLPTSSISSSMTTTSPTPPTTSLTAATTSLTAATTPTAAPTLTTATTSSPDAITPTPATTSPTSASTSPTPVTTSASSASTSPTPAIISSTSATTSQTPATTSPTPAFTSPTPVTISPTPGITSSTPTTTSTTSTTTSATVSISSTTHSNTTSTTLSGNTTTTTTVGPSSTIYSPSVDVRIFTPWNVACGQGWHIFVKYNPDTVSGTDGISHPMYQAL